jgi:hypothetical protein
MTANPEFDLLVRRHIYEVTLGRGNPPALAEAAARLRAAQPDILASFQRLAAAHILVLQPENGEILMANPFSAVPTPFLVELEAFSCYGNCIWDALGIPAMLRQNAHIRTACADSGSAVDLSIEDGRLRPAEGIIHFALPARRWWEDIVFN